MKGQRKESLIICSTSFADGRENVSGTLYGTFGKDIGVYITERYYPAFYTSSANYPIEVAVVDVDGYSAGYQEVAVGTTRTFGSPSSILGGSQVVTFKARSKTYHATNAFFRNSILLIDN